MCFLHVDKYGEIDTRIIITLHNRIHNEKTDFDEMDESLIGVW